ncbi:FAD-binding monooxygenase [Sphingomonas sp.]|uniref:FAD-binding monooxygenase n=1 Tax=Sphingomonas sp. TaxID=28214 RepID=UPI002DD62CE9|nr:FAD-binding monooxygenase [Sphingomonas sp.]
MQFHLDGFKEGDPAIADVRPGAGRAGPPPALPDETDVLVVGAGPAGLTIAAQLAAFADVRTCVVERKPGPLRLGQADGIACRTMEMFEAFGFSERVLKEAYWVNETCFWKPDPARREWIVRSGRIEDTEPGLSEFPHVILNQARVHDFYLDTMRNGPAGLVPWYGHELIDLQIEPDAAEGGTVRYPVTARFARRGGPRDGDIHTIRARFAIGCDGARSAVRQALGRRLHGDSANQAWGVMDVLAVTDFPDVRLKAVIHSASEGSALIIPREGGYLVRLYIELDELGEDERVADRGITVDTLVATARRILHPYTLDVKQVAWWSIYEIGQRLTDKFDDIADAEASRRAPCVFIAGDACHTHSPKAGQGMNVSMQDGFNLGWKVAAVLRGQCDPVILHSYSAERRAVAKELIDFDRDFARMFSAQPADGADVSAPGAIDPAEFQRYFVRQGRFTAGTATRYAPSLLCMEPSDQTLARGFPLGMRFHSAPVIRLADAKPIELGHVIKADGRWRLFLFGDAGDPTAPSSRLAAACDFLASDRSPVRLFTPVAADPDSVIDVRAVFQQPHRSLDIDTMPSLLLPAKGRFGLRDYEKLFCADPAGGRDIYDLRGIDRGAGCMVLVRPDQYVAAVLPLDAGDRLTEFLGGFMLRPAI